MTPDDVVFLLVILVPLFAARWRISLLGLALQGVLLLRASGAAHAFDWIDYLACRALIGPILLYLSFAGGDRPPRNDVIPPNLFSWAFVGALTLAAFQFAVALGPVPAAAGRIAVATAALLLGLFVLASQDKPFSQLIGVLRIENAIALFELAFPREAPDPVVRSAQILATFGALLLAAWFLRTLREAQP